MKFALAVLFGASLCAQSQPPSPTPRETTQNNQTKATAKQAITSNDHSNADSISTAIDELAAEVASWKKQRNGTPEKGAPPAEGWQKGSTIISAVATCFIAALAFIQAWVIHKQRLTMDRQADCMRDTLVETTKSANAARDSASAAKVSVEHAEKALQITERAYIQITGSSEEIVGGLRFGQLAK